MSDALFRLIGDGDRHSGGAIPLPDAFNTVVNELLDYGSADFRRLNHLISDVLKYKENRIMAAAWRTWPQFTHDVLTCLSSDMNLIKDNEYEWVLTEKFVPDYKFTIPGTDIPVVGRKYEDRIRREHNEQVYLQLSRDLKEFQEGTLVALDQSGEMNPAARNLIEDAVKLLRDADKILTRELGLDQPELTKDQIYYRKHSGRQPGERGKRLRSGMTGFFRDVFWEEYAEDGKWYDLIDVARKFEELHPEQPPFSNNNDMMGSMRKAGKDMVSAGVLEVRRVRGRRSWKSEYRKKQPVDPGAVRIGPVVTWEGLRGDPKA